MKKRMLLAAGIVLLAFSFAGCKSAPTFQLTFEQACPIVNADLAFIGASPLLTADQQDTIKNKVLPANQALCAAGGKLDVTSLKKFHDSLLPIAIDVVKAAPALPDQQIMLIALQAFGPLVQQLIDQVIVTVAPAPASDASGASVPAPSAPVTASGPVVAQ